MPTFTGSHSNLPATAEHSVDTVVSKDGTRIAFERHGRGTPVILVDAALCRRGLGPSADLATLLAAHFTVITYDRRGRGASGDTAPYAIEREVEDIEALIDPSTGGSAYLWGTSSGAVLALEAATRLAGVRKLVIYEPPLIVGSQYPTTERSWVRIYSALAAHDRSGAVREFLEMVGVPGLFVRLMRFSPVWAKLKAIAHTLAYDGALVRDLQRGEPVPAKRWSVVTMPTLVMTGATSADWMRQGNRALSLALPNASHRLLDGQTHEVKPTVHAPAIREFFGLRDARN
jgi:pimeloyl-ACP methyl ester carboxylesterase